MAASSPALSEEVAPSESHRDFLFAAVVLGSVLAALLAMTWQKWPDLLVDFGVQLYIPWKLAAGATLYRDIAYLTGGPLSQYFDALVFRIFGASVLTLVITNLVILIALLILVYRAFYRAAGQLTAIMAGLAILLAFAFEHYSDYGIFNYVTPYSEEIYQGLVLSTLAVCLLTKWVTSPSRNLALSSGFCCGLVFLAKAEVFLALSITVGAAFFLVWRLTGQISAAIKGLGWMSFAGAIPPLCFLLYFLRHGTFAQSIAWTCWAWTPLFSTSAADGSFYRWCLGLDAPGFYIKQMLIHFGVVLVIVTVAATVFRQCKNGWRLGLGWVVLAAILAAPAWRFKWEECGRCLPLLCVSMLLLLGWHGHKSGWQPATVFGVLWAIFSLAMLAKLGFNSRIWHYGFVLAMPASLSAIYLGLRILPDALEKYAVPANAFRSFLCALLAVGLFQLILGSKYTYQKKTVPIAAGADRLWTFRRDVDPTGADMAKALSWMQMKTPPNSTVAVLPAGAMLNFLLRRSNPTGYLRWNPPELSAFGQAKMTRAFQEHPPDFILLLGVDNSEFGVRFFGDKATFGQELLQWINQHYRQVCLIGSDWKKNGQFGIKVLQSETGGTALPALGASPK